MKKKQKNEQEESIWSEGAFALRLSPSDMKIRMRTFHMKHDEEMNFDCSKCKTKISAHNKDWHYGMCDECFDKKISNKEN